METVHFILRLCFQRFDMIRERSTYIRYHQQPRLNESQEVVYQVSLEWCSPQTNFHICCLVARNVTTKEGLLSFNNLGDTSAPPPIVDVYRASVFMTVLFDALCPFHLSSV